LGPLFVFHNIYRSVEFCFSEPKEDLDPKQTGAPVESTEPLDIEQGAGEAAAEELPAEGQDELPAEQEGENLAERLAEAQAQISQYHDQLLRAHAEVENVRRRAQDDVSKARKFGTEAFAESLIPVRDSLEAALAQTGQTAQAWQEGVEATLRQLTGAFERNQMREVAPQPGEAFDPHRHQAITTVPSEFDEGLVVQTLQKGYTIADRVLRPALVTVSAGKA
jgi:molecular chaperone GrpE